MCMAMCLELLCQAGVTCVTTCVSHLLFAEGTCLDPHRVQALSQPLTVALVVSFWLPWQQSFQLNLDPDYQMILS